MEFIGERYKSQWLRDFQGCVVGVDVCFVWKVRMIILLKGVFRWEHGKWICDSAVFMVGKQSGRFWGP